MTDYPFGKPEDSPGFLLWQTTVMWQRMIKKALDPYEISHAQFVILALTLWFEHKGDIPKQTMLISTSKLDKMTASKSLKKLVAQGFVQRSENTQDTRAKNVKLTNEGKAIAKKLLPLIIQIDQQFFHPLNKNEQQDFMKALEKLAGITTYF